MGVKKTTVTVDGIKIAMEFHQPEVAAPYPVLVICHGIPSGKPNVGDPGYGPMAKTFAQAGFFTVLFNFRGCGESGGNIDLNGWLRDVATVLDVVSQRPDVDQKRISLLGFSGGAAVSCVTAATRRDINSVVLAASPAEFSYLFPREDLTEMITRAREIGSIRDAAFPECPETWLELMHNVRAEDYIADVEAPVLIIHGTADDVVPVSHAKTLYSLASEPKELVLLEGAGHRLRQEPGAVDAALKWLLRWN